MIKTETLEEIITQCGIIKKFATLPDCILGHYHCDGNYYIILINEQIQHRESLYRTVLAEEIGHYRTTIGDITPRLYMCYRDRMEVDKMELLALKWATDFLLPTGMLLNTIKKKSISTLQELADSFRVTEIFMMQKFKFMAKQKPVWPIDENRDLLLYNLPSIHIFEKI